jgi:hypothetical protein
MLAEGGVYYSDQQFISAGADAAELNHLNPQVVRSRLGEFIRTFQVDPKRETRYIYG